MKAILTTISHDRVRPVPYEQYRFVSPQLGPEGRVVEVSIAGYVLENPLFRESERNWEYEMEITITAKPKQEGLIIKL